MTPLPRLKRVPASTYRFQVNHEFTFENVAGLVSYLSALGVTEVYSSPILGAAPGTMHGYDTCDHSVVNAELGGDEGLSKLHQRLTDAGMGMVVDFVPNHMSTDPIHNPWWRDVLANGPSSAYATFFDIDWDPIKPELKNRMLLPVLGNQYGVCLADGQLQVALNGHEFVVRYFERHFPLNPRQVRILLRNDIDSLTRSLGEDDPNLREYLSILFQLDHMPAYTETGAAAMANRRRELAVASERLEKLVDTCPQIGEHIARNVELFNGKPGEPASFDLLHELLEAQAYRLSYWRTALHEINYRRFFDINELAGIRMEDPAVFEASHAFLSQLIREGKITGLRLDHVDGLYAPAQYFEELHRLCAGDGDGVYTVVEKILSEGESLQPDWMVQGTTGYDFMNEVNGLFVDSRHARAFESLYARFLKHREYFPDVVLAAKRLIINASMASELNVLAHELNRMSEQDRRFRDFTLDSLQEALREIVACFPMYRTYLSGKGCSQFDEEIIQRAVRRAVRLNPALEASIFEFIHKMIQPSPNDDLANIDFERRLRFAMKFQQYTGPVQAKGLEDTAFYRYCPLVSLNEVGGEPLRFGWSRRDFHEANRSRLEKQPLGMISTATHDTKRGEDARARINVLSEVPSLWRAEVSLWSRINATSRREVQGHPAPDRNDEYLFYQALVGAWPMDSDAEPTREFADRMRGYMAKATKEAKVHTSWINPSQEYDEAVAAFVERVLLGPSSRRFLRAFRSFHARIARVGAVNSLGQLALKICSPGVPDFYQGTELWDLSLVDPDNRRPVDFGLRRQMLADLEPALDCQRELGEDEVAALLRDWQSGALKMLVSAAGLRLRRDWQDVMLQGSYQPVDATGPSAYHLVSFLRRLDDRAVLVVVPRLLATLVTDEQPWPTGEEFWKDTKLWLPPETPQTLVHRVTKERVQCEWQNGGLELAAGVALKRFPVAILTSSN